MNRFDNSNQLFVFSVKPPLYQMHVNCTLELSILMQWLHCNPFSAKTSFFCLEVKYPTPSIQSIPDDLVAYNILFLFLKESSVP
jgi:hypothetical protein